MLSQKDLGLIRGITQETVRDMLLDNNILIKGYIDQSATDTKREIRDELHSVVQAAVSASETRMTEKIDALSQNLHDFRYEVAEIFTEHVLPRIEALEQKVGIGAGHS